MAICRYFLQGTCRFGSRCRYEHSYPIQHSYGSGYGGGGGYRGSNTGGGYGGNYGHSDNYGASGGAGDGNRGENNDRGGMSILRAKALGTQQFPQGSSIFGQPPNTQQSGQYGPSTGFFTPNVTQQKLPNIQESKEYLQRLINEFTIWSHSGYWPLSCFALFGGQSCVPGLIDYSPEELRWFMYQARVTGNLEDCQQYVAGLYEKSKLVKDQLMTPSAQVLEILYRLSKGEKIEVSTPSPLFPENKVNNAASVFRQNANGVVQTTTMTPQTSFPSPATSFTFSLPNASQGNLNQNLGGFSGTPTSVFVNPTFNTSAPSDPGQSIFGGARQTQNIPASSSSSHDSSIYSQMSELTEEMMNSFTAPVFTMGSVPIVPPPKELCGLKQ